MMNVKQRIIDLRKAIRYPMHQRGDDRCWLDYRKGYALLSDTYLNSLNQLPSKPEGMRICTLFYQRRKGRSYIPKRSILEKEWDKDLENKSDAALKETMKQLERAWCKHRDTSIEKLTMRDDKALYRLLPEYEKVVVDFTLPPRNEFLGTEKECAGCPNFWDSHADCSTAPRHDPHNWGLCKEV